MRCPDGRWNRDVNVERFDVERKGCAEEQCRSRTAEEDRTRKSELEHATALSKIGGDIRRCPTPPDAEAVQISSANSARRESKIAHGSCQEDVAELAR